MNVKIIYQNWETESFEEEINKFIKDKKIIDIKVDKIKVLIMYEE